MRQTSWTKALLLGFVLVTWQVGAETILKGRYWETPPSSLHDRPFFLAHVFNTDPAEMSGGSYEIGLEIEGKKRRIFVLKPQADIPGGRMKSFPIRVVASPEEKNGRYRFFTRLNGQTQYSPHYSFNGAIQSPFSEGTTVIPLYTEALPEPGTENTEQMMKWADGVKPPPEIPFETEKTMVKTRTTPGKPVSSSEKPKTEKPVREAPSKPIVAGIPTKPPAVETSQPPRKIDNKEFKTLRTIDEELVIYVMKPGDSLKSVAEKYYGDPAKVRLIADINFIDNHGSVKVGEEIIVDVLPLKGKKNSSGKSGKTLGKLASGSSPASSASLASVSAVKESGEYTIQRGDTLSILAKRFFGSAGKASLILNANPGLNARNLKVGAVITIPQERNGKA